MMEETTISSISAISGLVGTVTGILALILAYRSRKVAEQAARRAQENEHKALVRDLTLAVHEVISESRHVYDFGHLLKQAYETLATFSGQPDGSRVRVHIGEVERVRRDEIAQLQKEAMDLYGRRDLFGQYTDDELTSELMGMEGYMDHIHRVKEKFASDLEHVERQNQLYREEAIKDT